MPLLAHRSYRSSQLHRRVFGLGLLAGVCELLVELTNLHLQDLLPLRARRGWHGLAERWWVPARERRRPRHRQPLSTLLYSPLLWRICSLSSLGRNVGGCFAALFSFRTKVCPLGVVIRGRSNFQ